MRAATLVGDFWGGFGAMLVALPSAIAFGVTIFSPLGGSSAAFGAVAGILGTTVLGLIAPALGGTSRLITAPCAPAAAVLSALAAEYALKGVAPAQAIIMITLIGLICGALQFLFGIVGIGRLIKYMPYPVVSGYLTGVGVIIIMSQIPKLLGAPKGVAFAQALVSPALWNWQGIGAGVATIAVMWFGPRLTKAVPAAILGLGAGVLAYFGLALFDRALLANTDNPLVVGPILGSAEGILAAAGERWGALGNLDFDLVAGVFVPAITLAVLLSIDTLKTCVVLDAMTRSRHDSNRELIGQGVANFAASAAGGVPGAGTMGATLVNISSGAQTRVSGVLEGVLALLAFLLLGSLIAWVPIAALAGILIVIGIRMIDWHSFAFLRRRSTILDFAVIAAVVIVATTYSLIAASGVGIALAVVLFVREQIGGAVVHRRSYGSQVFSKQVRLPEEMRILQERGGQSAIFELQGSLFFGTADQLYSALEADLKTRRYLILDLHRVQSVDITAAHLFEQLEDILSEREAFLIFSDVPRSLPSGRDMQQYFSEVGLVREDQHSRVFDELDDALEWVEGRILDEEHVSRAHEQPLELREMDLFAGRKAETLASLEGFLERRSCKAGERIFSRGDTGDELFLIRRGAVRIVLPLTGQQGHHLATFGRGNFFGEMSFLDQDTRSADAIAFTDTDLFVLSRHRFNELADQHKRLASQILGALARVLAIRLRYANAEVRALRDPGGS
jgi:SulP family sulfate permease